MDDGGEDKEDQAIKSLEMKQETSTTSHVTNLQQHVDGHIIVIDVKLQVNNQH